MPVYRYKCQSCKNIFEEFFLSFRDAQDQEINCPVCSNTEDIVRVYDKTAVFLPAAERGELSDEPAEYQEMHYYEKQQDWQRAAAAAEGISDFAYKKFLQRAENHPE